MMERVLIIGNSGSGKTTFAKKLASKTGLPLVHLDKLFWHGNWEQVTKENFDSALQNELDKERWIIDGNFSRTLPHRMKYCDTVFYFDLPTSCCLFGAVMRLIKNYGKSREDMGGSCPERFDSNANAHLKGIINFNRIKRKSLYELLNKQAGKTVIIFKNRRQVNKYLKALK